MKYFIIGSNSFSGSSFIDYLLTKKQNVYGISRSLNPNPIFLSYLKNKNIKKFKFKSLDINKDASKIIKLINSFRPNIIVNFASQGMVAESWVNPLDWYKTNLISQVKLIEGIKNFQFIEKYINFSTPEVYGSTKGQIKESFNFYPSTPYAISRSAFDMHLNAYFNAYNFPIIYTRAANVYGSTQQLYRIIPKTIFYFRSGKKICLHGSGKSKRSFIHISDVSKALYKISQRGKLGNTYHISTDKIISIKKLVYEIAKIMKVKFADNVIYQDDRLGKDYSYNLSSSKLIRNLKWNNSVDLKTGISEVIAWIDKNYDFIKKQSFEYKHKK
tara:strand:- start:33719 stop:34705 length:987 start_codon:yes stop_codon:yes gene_type:complete